MKLNFSFPALLTEEEVRLFNREGRARGIGHIGKSINDSLSDAYALKKPLYELADNLEALCLRAGVISGIPSISERAQKIVEESIFSIANVLHNITIYNARGLMKKKWYDAAEEIEKTWIFASKFCDTATLDYYPFLARDMEYVKNQTRNLKGNDFFTSLKIHGWLFKSCAYHFDQALEFMETKNPMESEYYKLGAVAMLGMVNRVFDSYKGGFYAIPLKWHINIGEEGLEVNPIGNAPYGFYKSLPLIAHAEKQRSEFTHGLFLSLKEYGADKIDGKQVDPDYRYVFAV